MRRSCKQNAAFVVFHYPLPLTRRCGGYTVFELVMVIGIIATISWGLYSKSGLTRRLSKGNFEAMNQVMLNIADAAENYTNQNGIAPSSIADTGYAPPRHPFGGIYGIQVSVPARWVRVTSTIPKGSGRAIGPASRVKSIDSTWDQAEIYRPFSTEWIWYDKKYLYGE